MKDKDTHADSNRVIRSRGFATLRHKPCGMFDLQNHQPYARHRWENMLHIECCASDTIAEIRSILNPPVISNEPITITYHVRLNDLYSRDQSS